MRKKFTYLISLLAAMICSSSGVTWGQWTPDPWNFNNRGETYGYWGTGKCDDITSFDITASEENGLIIGGNRAISWNYWPSSTDPATVEHEYGTWSNTGSPTGSGQTRTRPVRKLVWVDGSGYKISTGTATQTSYCTNCPVTSPTLPNYDWGSSSYSGYSGPTGSVVTNGSFGYRGFASDPYGHSHTSPITLTIKEGTYCAPLHFKEMVYNNAHWYHWRNDYSLSWSSSGVPTISIAKNIAIPPADSGMITAGKIIINDGKSVRMHTSVIKKNNTTADLVVGSSATAGYSLRFDQKLVATDGVTVSNAQDANWSKNIGANQTFGIWKGTDKTLHFIDGGKLLLGPNSEDQNISLIPGANGTINVNNYVCCNGSTLHANDALWAKHGIYFNPTTSSVITTDATSTINIINECDTTCGKNETTPIITGNTSQTAWLVLDGSKIPDLWKGNVNASASGTVDFPKVQSNGDAAGTHNVESRDNSIIWDAAWTVKDVATNKSTEDYQAKGNCCGSYILAKGAQTYNFDKSDNSTLTMKTTTGGIYMKDMLTYTGKMKNNNVDILGNGYVKIEGATDLQTTNAKDGYVNIESEKGFITVDNTFTYKQNTAAATTGYLTMWAKGACTSSCIAPMAADVSNYGVGGNGGGYIYIKDAAITTNTGDGTTTIKSENSSIHMEKKYTHTGVDGNLYVSAFETTPGKLSFQTDLEVNRTGTGESRLQGGKIKVWGTTKYTETKNGNGDFILNAKASGPCFTYCDAGLRGNLDISPNGGGYLWLVGAVTTTNMAMGTTTIQSDNHHVRMDNGFVHTGVGGDMLVDGETSVDIIGANNGKGVGITRDSIGNDKIFSDKGHIFVENEFVYEQTGKADKLGLIGNLTVLANGAPCYFLCNDTLVDGYVWLKGAKLTLTNKNNGSSTIKSSKHYVQIDGIMDYKGEATVTNPNYTETWSGTPQPTLLVSGFTGVDVLGATPKVTMDSVGQASFISESGHIHFKNLFTFSQIKYYSNNDLDNGLSIIANGACDALDCHKRPGFGYVWFEDAVATTTSEHARTEIVSVNHNVIMDKTLTHESKAEGNLHVIAGGECNTSCDAAKVILPALPLAAVPYDQNFDAYGTKTEKNLWDYSSGNGTAMNATAKKIAPYLDGFIASQTVDFSHSGRGYVHIGDAVTVDMDSIGNATFQSKKDIIQFDKAFNFNTVNGKYGDLYVDGFRGIRSKDVVTTKNPNYITQDVYGHPIAHDDYKRGSIYNTVSDIYRDSLDNDHTPYNGSGNVRYNSESGFVDFLSTFTHEAKQDSSRLDIEGWSRVKFADDVTITQSNKNDTTLGEAFIYSDNGYVNFMNKLTYTSRDADFRIWAKGAAQLVRSCIDSLDCGDQDGHINFHAPVVIDYTAQKETSQEGRTWIKSFNDDVFIDSTFTYKNANGPMNGMFWMQAGQDIYGRRIGEKILFTHPGEKSIVWEAQGSIRTKQDLTFDRANASAGNIVMKAGYEYTGGQNDAVYSHDVKGNSYSNPVNQLKWTQGLGGQAGSYCPPSDYGHRLECASDRGGDIWFQGITNFDLSAVDEMHGPDSTISVLVRAFNSVFVDSSLTYTQNQKDSIGFVGKWNDQAGYFRMFAENGNIEAINAPDMKVDLLIPESTNSSEIRLQAGNNPNDGTICGSGAFFCGSKSKWDGNILFNKPLNVTSAGKGLTILSAERDIENQVDAPFNFTYSNDTIMQPSIMTAGRHIETHKMLRFTYPAGQNQLYGQKADIGVSYPNENLRTGNYPGKGRIQILMQAGRLNDAETDCSNKLCKTIEGGTALTEKEHNNGSAQEAYEPNKEYVNTFSEGGDGHGSILAFDSIEFNYDGNGTILMSALNGNIESDPYLHRNNASRTNLADPTPNNGVGYSSQNNIHDAQITFNHGGTGVTRMEAIDIKLHDKLLYDAYQAAADSNGQFYMAAYDSVLTRNVMYINPTDTGSVFITTDKYKDVSPNADCGEYDCTDGGPGIHQGHIVLGYGADCLNQNLNDSIVFDFSGNPKKIGANLHIRAGFLGYSKNTVTGQAKSGGVFKTHPYTQDADKGKAYGGNITFDFMKVTMAVGDGNIGGYTEIQTPNGNIWGKDSLQYHGIDGNLRIDAGLGSLEDTVHAVRWDAFTGYCNGNGKEQTLNTEIPTTCNEYNLWRTGNIMMKGGSLNFGVPSSTDGGKGNAIFRTREGFIDTYDAFTVDSMSGDLVKYAGTLNSATEPLNEWGDVSERDFEYHQIAPKSGSIFYGADDNIMMNYGYSNYDRGTSSDGFLYNGVGDYDVTTRGAANKLVDQKNPYYYTSYGPNDGFINECRAIYNVNEDGYMWYRDEASKGKSTWKNTYHLLYRTCHDGLGETCSPITGECKTVDNKARLLTFNFDKDAAGTSITTGGLGMVATNYIDMFTKFTYFGGQGSGMGSVPEMNTLHGESVQGYGLYLKSLFNGQRVEKRRNTCEGCGDMMAFPMEGKSSESTYEWTYIGFHDDARIHTQNQKSLIEAPVVEFFGHAELDSYTDRGSKTKLTVKGDSLIFHDSAIFDGTDLELLPYTTGAQRQNDMRYGVINDGGKFTDFYKQFGPAIQMPDRNTPVLEFGYQRCNEPDKAPQAAPNERSKAGFESTPMVGGDVIVSFQNGFSLPIYNTVVANNARISFISDSLDGIYKGGEYVDTYIRTDLLRIRNRVEFYTGHGELGTDKNLAKNRRGVFKMSSYDYMDVVKETGIYPRHLHTEPGSELSLPGEDSLIVNSTTTVGGFGNIHENVFVKANGTIAPGFASLMEADCQTPHRQGKMTIHNLTMEKDAIFRISIGRYNPCLDEDGEPNYSDMNCTATDTLIVEDTVWFNGKIPLHVLPETEIIDEGCYLFLEYGDSLGVTPEYVKNFTLTIDRYQDYYFGLQYTPGKVYLCVMSFPQPVVQRYVNLPAVEGVTTTPNAGKHYVVGHQNFSFTAKYSGTPLKVTATGYYHGGPIDLDQTATILPDGSYQYTIYQVVQPYDVEFGPETSSVQVGNDYMGGPLVYAYKNTLHINVEKEDIVSIYNMTGVLYRKIEVPAGNSKFTLDKGMYIVTLKDGSVHKIVIK